MKTIGLFSGVLLFSVLCLLPEVRAKLLRLGSFTSHAPVNISACDLDGRKTKSRVSGQTTNLQTRKE